MFKKPQVFFLIVLVVINVGILGLLAGKYIGSKKNFVSYSQKLVIYLTVDVETPSLTEAYRPFETSAFVTGTPDGANITGTYAIAKLFSNYHLPGNFFLNVYEGPSHRQNPFPPLARWLQANGHQVCLHSHPNQDLGWYNAQLNEYDINKQKQIIRQGFQWLTQWTGHQPTAFRAGGYAADEDTLLAIKSVGLLVDSSMFFGNPHNHWKCPFTINRSLFHSGIWEVPVTVAYRRHRDKGPVTKLDLDWIGERDMEAVIHQAQKNHLASITWMCHSFSLLKFKRGPQAAQQQPLIPDQDKIQRLDHFLAWLSQQPRVTIALLPETPAKLPKTIQGDEFMPILK